MLLEAGEVTSDTISADVAVVGAGPAGLTVAAELAAAGADVLLLESGGLPYDRSTGMNVPKAMRDHAAGAQSLTRGSGSGEPYFPLRFSRARGLGGSTNALKSHGLRGRPMDSIDFGSRFGPPWPIPYGEFAAFLPDAEVYSGMTSPSVGPGDWTPTPLAFEGLCADNLVVAPFRHGDRGGFPATALRMAQSGTTRTVVGAVVVAIETDGIGSVTGLEVRSLAGTSFTVRAGRFVLATGAIDNTRLLLASRPALYLMDAAADNVGRYFMEHLHYVPGFLVPDSPEAAAGLEALVGSPEHPDHWLTLADDLVESESLLRLAYLPVPVHQESLRPAVPAMGELLRMLPYGPYGVVGRLRQVRQVLGGFHHVAGAVLARVRGDAPGAAFALSVMAEQPPHRASRITLAGKIDRVGLPLPHLHWRVDQSEFEDARRSTELLARELKGMGVGEVVSIWDSDEERPPVVTGGWHHMGTTRMSAIASEGVVDGDCRVHGIDNLYVAGSSVFPTGGYANPTLTLVALAVRLGRHLAAIPG